MCLCVALRNGTEEMKGRAKLRLRRSARVGLGVLEMIQDFSKDFLFVDEGDDPDLAAALPLQGVGKIDLRRGPEVHRTPPLCFPT